MWCLKLTKQQLFNRVNHMLKRLHGRKQTVTKWTPSAFESKAEGVSMWQVQSESMLVHSATQRLSSFLHFWSNVFLHFTVFYSHWLTSRISQHILNHSMTALIISFVFVFLWILFILWALHLWPWPIIKRIQSNRLYTSSCRRS